MRFYYRDNPLSEEQKKMHNMKSSFRCLVEHVLVRVLVADFCIILGAKSGIRGEKCDCSKDVAQKHLTKQRTHV
jgi:hypothetical protein